MEFFAGGRPTGFPIGKITFPSGGSVLSLLEKPFFPEILPQQQAA
jgi:hypothetical protein